MESNVSFQQQQQQEQGERDGDDCMGPERNMSGVTYPPHSFKRLPWEEAAGKISLTSVVMALALIGNCLVVTTVWRCRHLRTPTNVYISHLPALFALLAMRS